MTKNPSNRRRQDIPTFYLRRKLRLLILMSLAWALFILPAASFAQTAENPDEIQAGTGLPQTDEAIAEVVARLQESLENARQSYRSTRESAESTSPEQDENVIGRMRLHSKKMRAYEQHISAYRTLQETRRVVEGLAPEIEGWQGFKKPPPYPISLVDELRDAIHIEKLNIRETSVDRSIAQDDLEDARELLDKSGEDKRKITEELENPPTMSEEWVRLKSSEALVILQEETAQAEMAANETRRLVFEEVLVYHNRNLAFLESKLQTATEKAFLTEGELEARLLAIAEARQSTRNKLAKATEVDLRAQEALERARQALQQAHERMAEETDDPRQNEEERAQLQMILDAREAVADTTGKIAEGLRFLTNAHDAEQLIWEDRYRLYRIHDQAEFPAMLDQVDEMLGKALDYRHHFQSQLRLTRTLIMNQASRLAASDLDDDERTLGEQVLRSYRKRASFFESALARINELSRLLERWQEEVEWRRSEITVEERFQTFFVSAFNLVKSIWGYELFSEEDTFIIDGRPITERRPVTISKVVRALLILTFGLWLGSLLARGVRYLSAKILKIEQNVADLIEKTFRISVFIVVAFVALITVKIPLTVFAFLGGALAIGVGFGAQNLINNFISGIILLFERPIKVGDVVEVEGTRGRVVRIGGRCSQIRGFDGIDMLVPNSIFLEKSVVNWTLSDEIIRLSVTVGVVYGSEPREVSRHITEAWKEHGKIFKEPEPIILFEDFGESALIFTLHFWTLVTPQSDYRIVASDLRYMIFKRFKEAGITIAFPQLDVHFDNMKSVSGKITEAQLQATADTEKPREKT